MFSRFFIDRPIFAVVISLFIALGGLAAMRVLPIAQYPEIAPPVVQVRAVYPGASATVLEQTVAAPLENAINGVEGMLYMASTSSSEGVVNIAVTFNIGVDVDKAALNVNNRVKQVEPRLPRDHGGAHLAAGGARGHQPALRSRRPAPAARRWRPRGARLARLRLHGPGQQQVRDADRRVPATQLQRARCRQGRGCDDVAA